MGGRAKRGFGSATPSKPAECRILGTIGDRSVPRERKNHERSGSGGRGYVPTLLLKKKMAGESMCVKKEKRKKEIPGFVFNRGARCCGGVHQISR